jgi:Tfp pilus assembly protein PilF
MTVEQAAMDLLISLESMYQNDFGGYQCNAGEAKDIDAARDRLEQALSNQASNKPSFSELTQGEIMQMDLLSYTSVVDLAWAIETKVKEKNQWI